MTATTLREYLSKLQSAVEALDPNKFETLVDVLLEKMKKKRRIFVAGNGGSASTSQHWALDLGLSTSIYSDKRMAIVSLTDNPGVITAIGNDLAFNDIFVEQLKSLATKGDVFIAITCSGNSQNVVKALEYANSAGLFTVALTGFDGGQAQKTSQLNLHVPTQKGEYGVVEDMHLIINHALVEVLKARFYGS